MKRSLLILLIPIFLCIAIAFGTSDKPFLWKIDTKPPSYIFGTVHYPDSRIANPGEVVFSRLDKCSDFVMEVDLDEDAMSVMLKYSMLPDSLKLGDLLPEETYKKIDSVLVSMGQSIAMYSMMKPWVINLTLAMPPTKDTVQIMPMDLQLQQRAKQKDKNIRGLETVEEQIKLFDDQSYDEQVKMIEKTVAEFAEYEKYLDKLIDAYIDGDLNKLHELINYWSIDKDDAEFIEDILYKRNDTMFEGMMKLFEEEGKSFFVAVGAGHLAGEKGILQKLEDKGYEIKRITR
ncbi:MAG: TraB/GumN family protein [Candidatus Zixiibacteriota bacterium]